MVRRLGTYFSNKAQRGVAALEAALVAPVLLLAGLAVIDAAYLMLTVHKVESGLTAGAAYLARSRDPDAYVALARNVAVTGDPAGTATPIAKGWAPGDVTVSIDTVGNTGGSSGKDTILRGGDTIYVIHMSTTYQYQGLGLLRLVGLGELQLSGFHEERAFGAR